MGVILAVVSALWLVIAPFVYGIGTTALWSNVIAAVLIGGLAIYTDLGPLRFWGVAAVGLAVVVVSFFLALPTVPLWLNVAAGAVAIVAGYLGTRVEGFRPTSRAAA